MSAPANRRNRYPVTKKNIEKGKVNGLRYGMSSMQGWRLTMEDEHTIVGSLPDQLNDVSCFGLYDGHGGSFTAKYLERNFLRVLLEQPELKRYTTPFENRDDTSERCGQVCALRDALAGSFVDIDKQLRKELAKMTQAKTVSGTVWEEVDNSGSTCIIVLVTPTHIICANTGDSRALLRREGKVVPLSYDHKPTDVMEAKRIVNAGGNIDGDRLDGVLAVSRGIGDFDYKRRYDLQPGEQKVSCVPDITVNLRDHDLDEFILIACDGIWDVFSNDECSHRMQNILNIGGMNTALACERMLDSCLENGSKDNMTVITVLFKNAHICPGVFPYFERRRPSLIGEEPTSQNVKKTCPTSFFENYKAKVSSLACNWV